MSTITREFTKEQLITRAKMRLAMVAGFPDSQLAQMDKCLAEIAMELLTAEPKKEPELKPSHLANKFYERYPLETFKGDTDRSEAMGYFMAGAELQCFGEFINYADLMGDE